MDDILLEITDHGFSVFATRQTEKPCSPQQLADLVKSHHIVYGFLKDNIRILLASAPGKRIQIAAGKKNVVSSPQITFLYNHLEKRNYTSNKINRQQLDLLNPQYNIVAGQVIAHVQILPEEVSINVFGQHVPTPLENSPLCFLAGNHVSCSEDGLQLIAEKSGVLVFDEDQIHIFDEIIIDDTIDTSYPPISTTANLHVTGDIMGRLLIYVMGSLHVDGNIEMSSLEITHNLSIKGGIAGMNYSSIRVGGEINCLYIQQATAYAERINTKTGIMQSTIFAREYCYTEGKIIGGKVFSKEITAQEIGNSRRIETTLCLTEDPLLLNSYNQSKQEYQQQKHYLKTRQKNVLFLISKLALDDLPADLPHQQLLFALQKEEELKAADDASAHWWEELARELYKLIVVQDEIHGWEKIYQTIHQNQTTHLGQIAAQKFYANVHILIGFAEKFLDEEQKACSFYFQDGHIQQK